MYENKKELLTKLEFGSVDSESETDLDKKFIKTKDFEQFVRGKGFWEECSISDVF